MNDAGLGIFKFAGEIYMKRTISRQERQQGSVLLISLIFLILLAVIGMNGIRTASTDLKISRSYRVYHENLYLADGAAYEAVQKISDNAFGNGTWVRDLSNCTLPYGENLKDNATFWSSSFVRSSDFSSSDAMYVAYRNQTASPDQYYVFGRGTGQGGEAVVEIKFEDD